MCLAIVAPTIAQRPSHMLRFRLHSVDSLGMLRAMAHAERGSLRARFDEAAELYERARPGYPARLFDDLVELAGLGPGARVLEIGCGTGQATVPLAERGCAIVAVELGPALAAVARRKLARFPAVEVVVAAFEDWPLPARRFDLVLAATAFHWLDPAIRVGKAADALRPGGALAIVATHHIAGGTEPFFAEVQACYEQWDPSTPPGLRLQTADEIPTDSDELDRSGRFEPAVLRRYEWEQAYSTAAYRELLLTYSDQRARPPEAGARLLDCIAGLMDARYGGSIRKRYLNELRVARLRARDYPPR
jgi:SAM-dependent methyltransferase